VVVFGTGVVVLVAGGTVLAGTVVGVAGDVPVLALEGTDVGDIDVGDIEIEVGGVVVDGEIAVDARAPAASDRVGPTRWLVAGRVR
jgi:hypothetical protein